GARAKALWGAGFLTLMAGDAERAAPLVQDSLAIFREQGDRSGAARALLILANCNNYRQVGGYVLLLQQSVELARAARDEWCLAHALGLAGTNAAAAGAYRVARDLLEECLAVARDAQDTQGLRFGLIGLGSVATSQGDFALARELLEEGLGIANELD